MTRSAKWYAIAAVLGAAAGGIYGHFDYAPPAPIKQPTPLFSEPPTVPAAPAVAPAKPPGKTETPAVVSEIDKVLRNGGFVPSGGNSSSPQRPFSDAMPASEPAAVKAMAIPRGVGTPVFYNTCFRAADENGNLQAPVCRLYQRGVDPRE